MRAIVACGGTGGHAFPGLAVAEELRRRGHEVVIWSSGRDVESGVLRTWTGNVFATGARQLAVKNVFSILHSFFRCRRQIRKWKPDVLLAMGSYSSLPPVMAAHRAGVPIVLHEANTIPGRAVEFLSGFARRIAISFARTAEYLPAVKTSRTGLPVRSEIAKGHRLPEIPPDAFVVFVTGGSQGAHMVNLLASEALIQVRNELVRRGSDRSVYVIHQTGVKDEGQMLAAYTKNGVNSRVHAFERQMADAFASADLVICRAGASTCFELAACGKPAFMIPLPTAVRDHQTHNAEAFASAGAADVGVQAQLAPHQLSRYILTFFDNPERRQSMAEAMRRMATPDAAAKVAELMEKVV